MPFKITIEKITSVPVMQRGQWVVIEKRPYTNAELEDIPRRDLAPDMKEVMGYAPDRMGNETKVEEVYSQIVEELEITDVISAVNGL